MTTPDYEVYYGNAGVWTLAYIQGVDETFPKTSFDAFRTTLLETSVVSPRLSKASADLLLPVLADVAVVVSSGTALKPGTDTLLSIVTETGALLVSQSASTDAITSLLVETTEIFKTSNAGAASNFGAGVYGQGIYGGPNAIQ